MSLINKEDLTPEILASILKKADYQTTLDKNEVYIEGNGIEFPVWIGLTDKKLIKVFTFFDMNEGVSRIDALEFINQLNGKIVLPSFSFSENEDGTFCLWGTYFMPTEFGITEETLLFMMCRFASAFRGGTLEDTEEKFFS